MSKQVKASIGSSLMLTSTESIISEIWSDVLQTENIRSADNFFEQGGDSMMAMMVLFQVNDILHVELPPDVLFEAPTLREFCNMIDGMIEKSESQYLANDLP